MICPILVFACLLPLAHCTMRHGEARKCRPLVKGARLLGSQGGADREYARHEPAYPLSWVNVPYHAPALYWSACKEAVSLLPKTTLRIHILYSSAISLLSVVGYEDIDLKVLARIYDDILSHTTDDTRRPHAWMALLLLDLSCPIFRMRGERDTILARVKYSSFEFILSKLRRSFCLKRRYWLQLLDLLIKLGKVRRFNCVIDMLFSTDLLGPSDVSMILGSSLDDDVNLETFSNTIPAFLERIFASKDARLISAAILPFSEPVAATDGGLFVHKFSLVKPMLAAELDAALVGGGPLGAYSDSLLRRLYPARPKPASDPKDATVMQRGDATFDPFKTSAWFSDPGKARTRSFRTEGGSADITDVVVSQLAILAMPQECGTDCPGCVALPIIGNIVGCMLARGLRLGPRTHQQLGELFNSSPPLIGMVRNSVGWPLITARVALLFLKH